MQRAVEQVAVVTGGGRGIGRGIVKELAALSFSVVVNYRTDRQSAQSACAEAVELGAPRAIFLQADVADLNQPREAVLSLLCGKGFFVFLARWIACGRRPYPWWASVAFCAGWGLLSAAIIFLLTGPEPGEQLGVWFAAMLLLWSSMMMLSCAVVGTQVLRAARQGRRIHTTTACSACLLLFNGALCSIDRHAGSSQFDVPTSSCEFLCGPAIGCCSLSCAGWFYTGR